MRKGVALLGVMIVLSAVGIATSPAGAIGGHPFQILLNANGSGRIFMNDGSRPSWKVCKPNLTNCKPFAKGNFDTGGAPRRSVFWAGGDLRTPLWKGRVRSLVPPSVAGEVRGNEVVTPVAGRWKGGWADDFSLLSISICKTPSGEDCIQVNPGGYRNKCGSRGATFIDPAFAGRYLRVVEERYGSGTIFTLIGRPPYYPIDELKPRATRSTAIVGWIAPPVGPPKIDCGPPPPSEELLS